MASATDHQVTCQVGWREGRKVVRSATCTCGWVMTIKDPPYSAALITIRVHAKGETTRITEVDS